MKFYIASGLENADQVKRIAKILKATGWIQTYDWTEHGNVTSQGEAKLIEVSEKELQGVYEAQIVIVILPGGRGTHVELGAANVLKKDVFIYTEKYEDLILDGRLCSFYWNSNVKRVIGDEIDLIHQVVLHAYWQQVKAFG